MDNELKVKFSDSSIKFLESITDKEKKRVKERIKLLGKHITEFNMLPFKEMDIKNLSGIWEGFLRLRVGKIRVIFKYNREDKELLVYGIDFRGNIYK
jgi:mRNA interferase RelE/StbE